MILIERNGTFSLVDIDDLTAEEKQLYGVKVTTSDDEDKINNISLLYIYIYIYIYILFNWPSY